MARISKEERERRDAAYRVWVDNDFGYAAAAASAGVDEKELRRWETVHKWHTRWWAEKQEELASLRRTADEAKRLRALLNGVGAGGQRLFVSTEMKLDAVRGIFDIVLELGGEPADALRASLLGMAPDTVDSAARMARGVNREGQPMEIDPESREAGREHLLGSGLVSNIELGTLPLPELLALLRVRLRERGFEAEPQA